MSSRPDSRGVAQWLMRPWWGQRPTAAPVGTAFGEEVVDGGDRRGRAETRLDGPGAATEEAEQADAGEQGAGHETARQLRVREPPAVRHLPLQRVEPMLDLAEGQRNVSLDLL